MRYAILTFICALLTSQVHADERFLPYIDWLTANSNYQYNGEALPTITFMSVPLMAITVYGETTVATAELNGTELPEIAGIYMHDVNQIVFPEGVNPFEREDTLVHELLHFLQYVNLPEPDCVGLWEREAYELHWQWVEEHGKTAEYIEPNWLFVFMIEMSCTNPYEYR
jgi:hypothetical protein